MEAQMPAVRDAPHKKWTSWTINIVKLQDRKMLVIPEEPGCGVELKSRELVEWQ